MVPFPLDRLFLNAENAVVLVAQIRDDECAVTGTVACPVVRGKSINVRFDALYVNTSQALVPGHRCGITKNGRTISLCPLTLCCVQDFISIGTAVSSNILLLSARSYKA